VAADPADGSPGDVLPIISFYSSCQVNKAGADQDAASRAQERQAADRGVDEGLLGPGLSRPCRDAFGVPAAGAACAITAPLRRCT